MNYRILDEKKQQIKGSAFFHMANFIVYFGKSEGGKVRLFNKITDTEHNFENMDECFDYINSEKEYQIFLDE